MNILALGLGKFNTMCCFFTTRTQQFEFWTASTTPDYLRTMLTKNQIGLVVMEACGLVFHQRRSRERRTKLHRKGADLTACQLHLSLSQQRFQ
jgi:hypothetical protein